MKILNKYTGETILEIDGANLYGADLRGADLSGANLSNVKLYDTVLNLQCPEKGAFVGFKKLSKDRIAELEITLDAKRSSATTRKCRCSKAKVISITNQDNTEIFYEGTSKRDKNFIYIVGETIEVKDFDDDRWNECSAGIHFFITRKEAVEY